MSKQNKTAEGSLASTQSAAEAAAAIKEAAIKGTAEMSVQFKEKGEEIYLSSAE